MPRTEKQSGSTLTATPSRGHRPEVPEQLDRSVVLQTMLDPGRVRDLLAMPDPEGIAVQDIEIRSGREVFSCA